MLSHAVHLNAGITASTVEVWGAGRLGLMSLTTSASEWAGMYRGQVANTIFSTYGFLTPARQYRQTTPPCTPTPGTP